MVQTFCFCGVDPSIFSLCWCESAVGQHVNFNPPPRPTLGSHGAYIVDYLHAHYTKFGRKKPECFGAGTHRFFQRQPLICLFAIPRCIIRLQPNKWQPSPHALIMGVDFTLSVVLNKRLLSCFNCGGRLAPIPKVVRGRRASAGAQIDSKAANN